MRRVVQIILIVIDAGVQQQSIGFLLFKPCREHRLLTILIVCKIRNSMRNLIFIQTIVAMSAEIGNGPIKKYS